MKLARVSIALLIIQLALVSSIFAKYLYERRSCPRVWTKAVAYDPEAVMRGRYLSMQLIVNGCGRITPPAKKQPNSADMAPDANSRQYFESKSDQYIARLKVENNMLVAVPISKIVERGTYLSAYENVEGLRIRALPGSSCDALRLENPVNFYIAEHAADPTNLKPGQELWIEVTVPPKGAPRPLQLALKQPDGRWQPLAFQ